MLDFDTEGEKEKVLRKIAEEEKNTLRRKLLKTLKYAAILVALIGIGYVLNLRNGEGSIKNQPDAMVDTESGIQPGTDKAILTLENGEQLALEKGKQLMLKGMSHSGEQLVYDEKPATGNKLRYNYLTIPKGGQFFVQLSDGSKVWLNSDSKLKYPVNFVDGQPRRVELIYGEAYFDVSESTDHSGASFIVQTDVQEITVLGTEFNIKAYTDETSIVTTLVEGSVSIGNGIQETFLKPAEQSIVNLTNNNISIKKVNKVFDEIAWKEGYFSFKSKTMKEIMKTLSRWYNIEYTFEDPKKEEKKFTGVLDRESTIDQILMHIQKTNEINFQIYDKTVIIK